MYRPQNSFYESNYQKVVFYMKLSITAFLCLAAILVSAYNLSGAFPFVIVITVLVLYLIASDAILFTMYKRVMDRDKKRNTIFNSTLFQPFHQHLMDNQLIFTKNKWQFTEETLMMKMDSFNIICNPAKRSENAIDFNFQAQGKLNIDDVGNVISFFSENGIDIYSRNKIDGIMKTVEINNKTATELYDEILKTIELLKNNDFKPFNYWQAENKNPIFINH